MLDGWQAAGFDARVGSAFALLEAVARNADGPTPTEVTAAREAGLSDDAIVDALAVGFVFNLINRLADAFGFDFGDEEGRLAEARALHKLAYRVPGFLLA
jgi:alkylhydroperoxidase family enzyme